jgi:hypothetical protein
VKNSPLLTIRKNRIDRWLNSPDAYYAAKFSAADGAKIGKWFVDA